jgi:hypothetical protein
VKREGSQAPVRHTAEAIGVQIAESTNAAAVGEVKIFLHTDAHNATVVLDAPAVPVNPWQNPLQNAEEAHAPPTGFFKETGDKENPGI